MKSIAFSLVLGSFIGFSMCYYIFVKTNGVEAVKSVKYISIEKNKNEIKNKPTAKIALNNKDIKINNKLDTPYYGNIELSTIINRKKIQYNHQIEIGAVSLINSKSFLINTSYSYKNIGFNFLAGYSFVLNTYDIGIGIKYIYKF